MARINIEEEAWKRLYKLAEYMDKKVCEVIGPVVCLWSNSQDLVKTHGSKEDIIEWANLFGKKSEEIEIWLKNLEKSRFIFFEKNDLIEIRGNQNQLESRAKHASKSAKGGKALKKKLLEAKRLKASLGQATGTPVEGHGGLKALHYITDQDNALQGSAIQGKAEQDNSKQDLITKKPKTEQPKKANAFIARYCENFKFRYGSNPVIKGKETGIAKRLVKDLSEEKISLYLDAYFEMPDAYVVKAKHPLSLLETKFNEVTVFAHSGDFMTNTQARQADDTASNMLLLEKVRRGEL